MSFSAPANASGTVAFSYQISDQLGDVSTVISDTLAVDPGPRITDTTTPGEKIAHGTTVAVGTVTPGLPGDTLTLTELTGPVGAVTLRNGVVSFAAPANVSGTVAFSYRISDQLGDVSSVISDALTVDPGPRVSDQLDDVSAVDLRHADGRSRPQRHRHHHGRREGRARHHRRGRHRDTRIAGRHAETDRAHRSGRRGDTSQRRRELRGARERQRHRGVLVSDQ